MTRAASRGAKEAASTVAFKSCFGLRKSGLRVSTGTPKISCGALTHERLAAESMRSTTPVAICARRNKTARSRTSSNRTSSVRFILPLCTPSLSAATSFRCPRHSISLTLFARSLTSSCVLLRLYQDVAPCGLALSWWRRAVGNNSAASEILREQESLVAATALRQDPDLVYRPRVRVRSWDRSTSAMTPMTSCENTPRLVCSTQPQRCQQRRDASSSHGTGTAHSSELRTGKYGKGPYIIPKAKCPAPIDAFYASVGASIDGLALIKSQGRELEGALGSRACRVRGGRAAASSL